MKKLTNWVRENKIEFIFLLAILLLGTFLRFYQIYGHATFLGDEGRDVLIVKRMIVDHQFTLLGPTVSFGNLYLGPIYYYMMIIPLWLSGLDPVGPAMMVASLGVLTIFLVWKAGYDFFGKTAAFAAASLYAVSPPVIRYSHSSWNPNPMPFFALLAIYALFRAIKNKDGRWLALLGLSLGITLQLHYMALVLLASVFLISLILRVKLTWKWYLLGIGAFLLSLSPQIIFELRHNFVNSKALLDLLLRKGQFTAAAGIGVDQWAPFSLYPQLFSWLLSVKIGLLGLFLSIVCGLTGIYLLLKERAFQTKNLGLLILLLWILLGVLLVSFYRGQIYDYYLGFLFPAPFLFLGFTVSWFWRKSWGKVVGLGVFLFLLVLNLSRANVFSGIGPNFQIERTKIVAQTIAEDVGERKFNLALVSPTKDFMALNYRYFLELFGKKPVDYGNFKDIDILYVIEEIKWVSPEQLGLWEVGTFGPFVATRDWTFDFQVVVYRLEHQK